MSKEKQIIEIKECVDAVYGADCAYFDVDGFAIADKIYNAGYRKQREGHWISKEEAELMDRFDLAYTCSVCGHCDWDCTESENFNFCPNCGAKMKGGS